MSDQSVEEIPNRLVMAELEAQLHARTSELVIANARIRARDEEIARLRSDLHIRQSGSPSDASIMQSSEQ